MPKAPRPQTRIMRDLGYVYIDNGVSTLRFGRDRFESIKHCHIWASTPTEWLFPAHFEDVSTSQAAALRYQEAEVLLGDLTKTCGES